MKQPPVFGLGKTDEEGPVNRVRRNSRDNRALPQEALFDLLNASACRSGALGASRCLRARRARIEAYPFRKAGTGLAAMRYAPSAKEGNIMARFRLLSGLDSQAGRGALQGTGGVEEGRVSGAAPITKTGATRRRTIMRSWPHAHRRCLQSGSKAGRSKGPRAIIRRPRPPWG